MLGMWFPLTSLEPQLQLLGHQQHRQAVWEMLLVGVPSVWPNESANEAAPLS